MKCSIKEALFTEFFFFVFIFKFIVHVLTKLWHPLSFFRETQKNIHKSCENVSFCFCTDQKDVAKNIYMVVDQELGGGELSLSVCPVVGNRPPTKKKYCKSQGVCLGREGGCMVSSKIEPCIMSLLFCLFHPPTPTRIDWQQKMPRSPHLAHLACYAGYKSCVHNCDGLFHPAVLIHDFHNS